jgi:hypothetical protein
MSLDVIIENENRTAEINQFSDISNILIRLAQRAEKVSVKLNVLAYIDPYGDTTFNSLQQTAAIEDIDKLSTLIQSEEEREILAKFKSSLEIAKRMQRYLRIIGD